MPSDERTEAESAESTLAPIKEWYHIWSFLLIFQPNAMLNYFMVMLVMVNRRHIEEKNKTNGPTFKICDQLH